MRVLITGRSGSGKSTICRELQQRGYPAFDGDQVEGLARWVDPRTGKIVQFDSGGMIDKSRTQWQWDQSVLEQFLSQCGNVILCGSADNDLALHEHFDKIFVLSLPPELQRERIQNRTEHNYGKLPAMQDMILAEQQQLVHDAARLGAIQIDAARKPAEIAIDILRQLHAN